MDHYGLLGYPLRHTMSPPIHKRLFELAENFEAEYTLKEIPPEELEDSIPDLMTMNGFNITIPHKISIVKYLDELDASAERYDSVNCVSYRNGSHIGYNTDCDGFLRALEADGVKLGGSVLQCGCGGVGRMMAIEAVRAGADITLSLLPGFEETAAPVRQYAEENGIDAKITVLHPDEISGKFDMLINASPVGMYPNTDACPVSEDVIAGCGYVFDAIYNPEVTKLIGTARRHGIKASGGMAMLVWQAVVAHEYWEGSVYDRSDIDALIADMHKLMQDTMK